MEPYILFNNKDCDQYQKYYSNRVSVNQNMNGREILIDFLEESYEPRVTTVQYLGAEPRTEYSRDEHEILVNIERKCTIVLDKRDARRLGQWLINMSSDSEETHNGEEQD